jgi:putative flippase GtrA
MKVNETELIKGSGYVIKDEYSALIRDIFKYGFVSIFALVVDIGVLYISVEYLRINYILAATIAFCFGLAVNYVYGKVFVFKNSKLPPLREFIWYAAIGVIGLGLNDIIIYILVWMQLWYLYAKAVSVAVVFFFNFFGRRRLFREQ